MWRKIVAMIVLVAFCMACGGCYNTRLASPSELKPNKSYHITRAVLSDGEVVTFAYGPGDRHRLNPKDPKWGWPTIQDTLLTGWRKDEFGTLMAYKTPISNVHAVYIRNVDAVGTIFATLGGIVLLVGIAALIVIATKESCPFIYSYDGEHYQFDGEPYGGATCPALQRTDYCRLDSLRLVDGKYRLLLTNEVDETQHTDELTLLAVDHPSNSKIVPDADGRLHTINSLQSLSHAASTRDADLTRWFEASDLLAWESDLQGRDPQNPADLRDSLFLSFPRPDGITQAKLVVNAGTTLWGSQMLKQAEELWGDQLPAWQSSLSNPASRLGLQVWSLREEAYNMQVRVRVHDQWVTRGEIVGGGPFMIEDRVVPLDLEGVEGDNLQILLTPPAGFWQLNWFAVDCSADSPVTTVELAADSAIGHDGSDIRAALKATDSVYYSAPETGQTAHVTFLAPPLTDGMSRTVFARASGYYDIHHATVAGRQDSLLQRVQMEPGYFARFALERYQDWQKENLAKLTR